MTQTQTTWKMYGSIEQHGIVQWGLRGMNNFTLLHFSVLTMATIIDKIRISEPNLTML